MLCRVVSCYVPAGLDGRTAAHPRMSDATFLPPRDVLGPTLGDQETLRILKAL